jgi:hypothetical protein
MEDVSATRAYETPNTQTALLKYVKLWTMIWPQTSRTYCCKLVNHRDAKRHHVKSAKLQAVRPNPIIGTSPCRYVIAMRLKVKRSFCSSLILHSATCKKSKIGFDLAQNRNVCEILQAPRIPHHSKQINA